MDLNKNILIELVGVNEADKETLIDYFEEKEIANLFIEYDVLDISEISKIQIANLFTILENHPGEK